MELGKGKQEKKGRIAKRGRKVVER